MKSYIIKYAYNRNAIESTMIVQANSAEEAEAEAENYCNRVISVREYIKPMQITQEDFDRYIIGWHITANNHVWIDSTIGGYVETTDSGKYYSGSNYYRAIIHRIKDIKKYEKMYLEDIKNEKNH